MSVVSVLDMTCSCQARRFLSGLSAEGQSVKPRFYGAGAVSVAVVKVGFGRVLCVCFFVPVRSFFVHFQLFCI